MKRCPCSQKIPENSMEVGGGSSLGYRAGGESSPPRTVVGGRGRSEVGQKGSWRSPDFTVEGGSRGWSGGRNQAGRVAWKKDEGRRGTPTSREVPMNFSQIRSRDP